MAGLHEPVQAHGVSCLSVAFFTSFCIEIEPSEQVVWLWKSPLT
jgi:hypothetical protein